MLVLDTATRHAIRHTTHCLIGCGIGETIGNVIATGLAWSNIAQTALAILLAFAFGYGLTYWGGLRMGMGSRQSGAMALRTDTVSIFSMVIIDNTLEWLIPGAMNAVVASWLFWWSMAVSLAVAFMLTVPVNRYMLIRFGVGHGDHH
jgi:hypothetical protein